MHSPARLIVAPILDALCISTFVLVGRSRHEIDEGFDWFFTVAWPLFVGWAAIALATRLYVRYHGMWLALLVTWLGGIALASVLRGTFTDRPYVGIFTIVAIGYIGLTAFGWRAVAAGVTRIRRREASVG
jgi:hypothetical protein